MNALGHLRAKLRPRKTDSSAPPTERLRRIAIVGSPNVGKSVLFNAFTGARVVVSNYPGTTVEVSRGHMRLGDKELEVVDTPGMYSLASVTEEERVARTLLLQEKPDLILQVIDAKNLARMLPFTLQLLEAGLPLMLVLNIMDEAVRLGMTIDCARLEKELGIPVVPTISITGEGLELLQERMAAQLSTRSANTERLSTLDSQLSTYLPSLLSPRAEKIFALLKGEYGLSRRAVTNLLLNEDKEMLAAARQQEGERFAVIQAEIDEAKEELAQPPGYLLRLAKQKAANRLVELASTPPVNPPSRLVQLLGDWMMRPLTGIPILFLVLYVGIYLFVGRLGAGVFVDGLQKLFTRYLDPWVTRLVEHLLPYPAVQDLLVHDYGIITLGLKYAVAIILPIVTTFFLVFSVIEDTGYLPRLALLIDRFFKKIGLSGRAVIPMVLGFGCDTMATLVTRVLETRRERIIATLLLALAIPCSAQLGVILGLLAHVPYGLFIWGMVVGSIFLLVGYLSSRLIKGQPPSFYIEVPPLRWPKLGSILTKTYARLEWYFMEIMPVFLLASVLIWLGRHIILYGASLFDWLLRLLQPAVTALGLPPQATTAFLFGFFRRDYGAAGLYDLHARGLLNGVPLVVAMVTLTLFLPCVAQLAIMHKERGLKTTAAIVAFILPFAWLVGFLLYHLLNYLGVKL